MNEPAKNQDAGAELEQEADTAIAVCDGDVRAALVANSFLMAENEKLTRAISLGYRRGKMPTRRRASMRLGDWREISDGDSNESE
jgi:hypothetical protein